METLDIAGSSGTGPGAHAGTGPHARPRPRGGRWQADVARVQQADAGAGGAAAVVVVADESTREVIAARLVRASETASAVYGELVAAARREGAPLAVLVDGAPAVAGGALRACEELGCELSAGAVPIAERLCDAVSEQLPPAGPGGASLELANEALAKWAETLNGGVGRLARNPEGRRP